MYDISAQTFITLALKRWWPERCCRLVSSSGEEFPWSSWRSNSSSYRDLPLSSSNLKRKLSLCIGGSLVNLNLTCVKLYSVHSLNCALAKPSFCFHPTGERTKQGIKNQPWLVIQLFMGSCFAAGIHMNSWKIYWERNLISTVRQILKLLFRYIGAHSSWTLGFLDLKEWVTIFTYFFC